VLTWLANPLARGSLLEDGSLRNISKKPLTRRFRGGGETLDAGKWGPNSGSSESLFFYVQHTGASGPHVCQAVGGRASIGSVWQTLMWWPPPTSGDGRWFEALSNANGTGTNALTSGSCASLAEPHPRRHLRLLVRN
jgi:hypothetical protein